MYGSLNIFLIRHVVYKRMTPIHRNVTCRFLLKVGKISELRNCVKPNITPPNLTLAQPSGFASLKTSLLTTIHDLTTPSTDHTHVPTTQDSVTDRIPSPRTEYLAYPSPMSLLLTATRRYARTPSSDSCQHRQLTVDNRPFV